MVRWNESLRLAVGNEIGGSTVRVDLITPQKFVINRILFNGRNSRLELSTMIDDTLLEYNCNDTNLVKVAYDP